MEISKPVTETSLSCGPNNYSVRKAEQSRSSEASLRNRQELASEAKQEQQEQAQEKKQKTAEAAPAELAAGAWSQPLLLSTGSLALGALVAVAAFAARLRRQRQVQLNGAGDYLMYAEAAIEVA